MEVAGLDRLKDHYKYCIKLSANNKINPKNAFDLQLIDHMKDLVSTPEDGQMNFKVASSALDVGAKIYANRVDCIQSEAQKVASSILMALDDPKGKHGEDCDQANGDTSTTSDTHDDSLNADQDGQRKTKKKRNTKNIKTITESSALDAKLDQMVLGDPFLDGLSRDYDMSCPAALICYNPQTQPNCLLTIESDFLRADYRERQQPSKNANDSRPKTLETINEEETDQDHSEAIQEATATKTTTTLPSSQNLDDNSNEQHNSLVTLITKHINCAQVIRSSLSYKLCPRLTSFLFNDRTTTLTGLDTGEQTMIQPDDRPKPSAGGDHEFVPEVYDGGDDHFADSVMGDDDAERHDENIPDLEQIAAWKPTDYGYSTEQHHRLKSTWLGPHAWKIVKTPKNAPKSTKKRVKLEHMPIDFNSEDPLRESNMIKTIKLSSKVLGRWKRPLYPQDHNLKDEATRLSLVQPDLRPGDIYKPKISTEPLQHDADEDDIPPSSPSPMGGFDDVDDSDDDDFQADPVVDGNEVAVYGSQPEEHEDLDFAGEDLIEQPFTVAQVNIPFAKAAKKMDVRRLKRVMWDLLFPPEKRLSMTAAQELDNDTQVAPMETDGDQASKTISPTPSESPVHLEFSGLYGGLPVKISPKMATDLSQSIAFVTLLHLANEKNLKLIPKQNLKDFIIEQDDD